MHTYIELEGQGLVQLTKIDLMMAFAFWSKLSMIFYLITLVLKNKSNPSHPINPQRVANIWTSTQLSAAPASHLTAPRRERDTSGPTRTTAKQHELKLGVPTSSALTFSNSWRKDTDYE
eukprot:4515109-Pleurochrysis_carterae.AAC.1